MKLIIIITNVLLLFLQLSKSQHCDENGICGIESRGGQSNYEEDDSDDPIECLEYLREDGGCTSQPGWIFNCPKTLQLCLLDLKVRCNRNNLNLMSALPIYSPGDMNAMFESIEKKFSLKYHINILSRDPWIISLDNFVTDVEIRALLGSVEGKWARSEVVTKDSNGPKISAISENRTSVNAWCKSNCNSKPYVKSIHQKIEDITEIPKNNYEPLQLLKYETGQKYNVHHDLLQWQNEGICGPRILTFFLYLSDVTEGGETHFPSLNITIKPKKGSAVLWPSTYNENLHLMDERTYHEAKAVVKGQKYAANAWIHLYNYEIPDLFGCMEYKVEP